MRLNTPVPTDGNRHQPTYVNINEMWLDVPSTTCNQFAKNIHLIANRGGASVDAEEGTLAELFSAGEHLMATAYVVNESLKTKGEYIATPSPRVTKKYKIAGSLCAVLGVGVALGGFIHWRFRENFTKSTLFNVSLSPAYSTAASPVISPYYPLSATGVLQTTFNHESGVTSTSDKDLIIAVEPTTPIEHVSAKMRFCSENVMMPTTRQPLPVNKDNIIKKDDNNYLQYESTLHLPWQKIVIHSGNPLPLFLINKIKKTIIKTKETFFEMFTLNDNHRIQFADKPLIINLYSSQADFFASLGISKKNKAGLLGRFSPVVSLISAFTNGEETFRTISHEYVHFLDALFNKRAFFIDNKGRLKRDDAFRWWSEGLANYIARGCTRYRDGDNQLEKDIMEGNPYTAGARIQGFFDSTEELKALRIRIAAYFATTHRDCASTLLEDFIKNYSDDYKHWMCKRGYQRKASKK